MDSSVSGSNDGSPTNLKCLFCRAEVRFEGLPAILYEAHLGSQHSILHDKEKIIIWTLLEQFPALIKPGETSKDDGAKPTAELQNKKPQKSPKLVHIKSELCSFETIKDDRLDVTSSSTSTSTEPRDADLTNDSVDEQLGSNELDSSVAGAVPWYCGLLYSCKICPSQFFELSGLKRHLSEDHKTSYKDAAAEHGDMIAASNIHECFICGRGMPHCLSSIKHHLNKVHEMSVSSYYDEYKEDIDCDPVSLPITDPAILGVRKTPKYICSPRSSWLNQCTYLCKICDTHTTTNYASFLTHIQQSHSESAKSYAEKFGKKFATESVSHICQLCGVILDWDRTPISKHLYRLHPLVPVQKYIQTFKDTYSDNPVLSPNEDEAWMNGCGFQCRKCQPPKDSTTRNQLVHHLHHEHQLNLTDYTKEFGSIFTKFARYCCLVCNKSVRWDSDSIAAHLDKHSITPEIYARDYLKESKDKVVAIDEARRAANLSRRSDWLNQCNFSCKQCSFVTKFYHSFMKHISAKHNLKTKDYKDRNNGEFYTKAVYHFCQLCGHAVIWNRDDISRHLRLKHKAVTTTKYEEMFKACYSEDKVFDESEACKWMNRCNLPCKECNDQPSFDSKDSLTRHLYKVHSMTLRQYQANHTTIYSFYELYTCKVCDKAIRWESGSIVGHLSKHKMTPEQYVSEVLNGDLKTHLEDLDKMSKASQGENTIRRRSFHDWLNRSSFSCLECPFKTGSTKAFVNHLSKSHRMTGKEFVKKNGGKLFSSTVNHTCQLCGFILAWERISIRKHLNIMHRSVTIQDYNERFMNTYTDYPELPESAEDEWMNQCKFSCKLCPKPSLFSTRSKLVLHLTYEHQMTIKAYIAKKRSVFSTLHQHSCKICDKTIRWDRDTITAHLDKSHSTTPAKYFEEHLKDNLDETLSGLRVPKPASKSSVKHCPTLKWSDKCKFACHICYQVVGSKNVLKWHLANEHKMCGTYLHERCPSKVLSKVTHGCLVCGEEILFDSSVLKKHLESCHGRMSEQSYKSEYYSKYNLEEDLEEERPSDWMVKSFYGCKVCRTIFAGKDRLTKHMTSEHLNSNQQNGSGIMEEHFLNCLVEDKEQQRACLKKVVWDMATITDHLSTTHSLTPEEYHSAHHAKGSMLDKIVRSEQENWMNKCSFLCKTCHKNFVTVAALTQHAKESHDIEMEEGRSVTDNVVNFLLHSCQVCSENILWEEGSLTKHLTAEHNIPLSEYFTSYMHQYSNNEECKKEVQEFGSWTSKCVYRCVLCPDSPEMVRKRALDEHMHKRHPECTGADLVKLKEEAFVKKLSHVCQVCGVSVLWDGRSLQVHIDKTHHMQPATYRALFMSEYTEDLDVIEQRRQECRRQGQLLGLSVPGLMEVDDDGDNSGDASMLDTSTLEDDLGMTKEIQKWAQGCLYSCTICKTDIAGARPFESHLLNEHKTKLTSYKEEHGANQVMTNFHFCKLCCTNVKHDELDLKHHFDTAHSTTVSNYFEMFRGKLRFARLERPKSTKDNSFNGTSPELNTSSELKRKRPSDAKIDVKKRKTRS